MSALARLARALLLAGRPLGAAALLRGVNAGLRRLATATHWAQYTVEWGRQPTPTWYDHHLDQYYAWRASASGFPWERGVLNALALRRGGRALELCCGDGFNTYHFYAEHVAEIVAVDLDARAISHARRRFARGNIAFAVADIRAAMPAGPFDNVIWDAAVEPFTPEEVRGIIDAIRSRLGPDGILSGYTVASDGSPDPERLSEVRSMDELAELLAPRFANVRVVETRSRMRHNLYFHASDGPLPLADTWPQQRLRQRRA